ncbi:Lrp/AsnC family transcriptional regulator [uncultured Marinococcus sp.]|uniref:Lrp/AsnC family transcriptional regulator n=1 Tax=uncultured Marinococcus sp. TaxID=487012 RepID=UPI0026339ADB|nr:Lrp/AsnC family transcriptional regulator [uncultured Marinococcus sp.]
MPSLDQTDWDILRVLQQNAKASCSTIAKLIYVSEGTVRTRMRKLLEAKVFNFIIYTDPKKIGLDVQAIIGIHTQTDQQRHVAFQLQAFEAVRFVGSFSGTHDLIIQVYFPTKEDLVSFINTDLAATEGVIDVEVNVELKQYKDTFSY